MPAASQTGRVVQRREAAAGYPGLSEARDLMGGESQESESSPQVPGISSETLENLTGHPERGAGAVCEDPDPPVGQRGETCDVPDDAQPGKARAATKPAPEKPSEARRVLDAISDIINHHVEVKDGIGRRVDVPAAHADVPGKYQALLWEWYTIAHGTLRYKNGVEVSYRGDMLAGHIDTAAASTEPLVRRLLAEDEDSESWIETMYRGPLKAFRARAVEEAVKEAVRRGAAKGLGGGLDITAMTQIEGLRTAGSQALSATRAAISVTRRVASSNTLAARKLDALFAEQMSQQASVPSLETTRSMGVQSALTHVHGGLNLVNAITNVADPDKRAEIYREHAERFGPAAGAAAILQNLGQFVSGVTAVLGSSTWAVAKVLGKSEMAAKVLQLSGSALGKINVALNVFGVVHGVCVLLDDDATTEEKGEAMVEVGAGGLGLAGRFVPMLSAPASAASASLLINFHAFKATFTAGSEAFAGMIALGLNEAYAYMREQGKWISQQSMSWAAALDLAGVINDPAKVKVLERTIKESRWNLVDQFIREFMVKATTSGANANPGEYEVLKRRFALLVGKDLKTNDQVADFTKQLLEAIVACHTDAKQIYQEQVEYTWANH